MDIQFSIITAVLNRRSMISRAIESAKNQGFLGVEHIVVDGGSTDGTLEVLAKYPHLDVTSGPDEGLYDAWNKGIARAKGEFIVILNSDDELPDNAFYYAREIIENSNSVDMISGPIQLQRTSGEELRIIDDLAMLELRFQDIGPGIPLTNGRYFSRKFLEKVGPFDQRYSVIADRQFFLRARIHKPTNILVREPLYRYHIHDGSLSLNDNGPSFSNTYQCLTAAVDGMNEAKSEREFHDYRRWRAWCIFYLCWLYLRNKDFLKSLKVATSAEGKDPFWIFRVPSLLLKHMLERKARQGRLVV